MSSLVPTASVWLWSRSRRANVRLRRRPGTTDRRTRSTTFPTLSAEPLEPRALLAVTASLSGTVLQIGLSSAGDAATLANDGTNYLVSGTGLGAPLSFAANGVSTIAVTGTDAADGQSFTVGKGTAIGRPLNVSSQIEATTVTGAITANASGTGNDVRIGSPAITLANSITNIGGGVVMDGAVTLAADVTVTLLFTSFLNKQLRFAGTVDGAYKLTTVNGQLDTFFDGVVGGKTPLASLTTSNQTSTGRISLKSVTTTGAQQYNENATLAGAYTTSGGGFGVGRALSLAGDTTVSTAGGNVTLAGTVDGARNLEIAAGAGSVALSKAVGGLTPLASLAITSANGVTAGSTVGIDGSAAGAKADGLTIAAGVNKVVMTAVGSVVKNCAGTGIVLGGSSGSTLSGFTSRNNAVAGLQAAGTFANTVVAGNSLRFNPTGAVLQAAKGLFVNGGNDISDNTVYGVAATGDSSGSLIAGNVVARNSVGVSLTDATNLEISGQGGVANSISSNVNYGVFATGTCDGTVIAGNVITANSQGIVLSNAQGLSITGGNSASSNTNAGLAVYGESKGTVVAGNTFVGNSIGILMSDAKNLEISGKGGAVNSMSSNVNYGLYATGVCTGAVISGNVITTNSQGIVLSNAQGISITGGNSASFNTNAGLAVYGDSQGTVVGGNAFVGNSIGILMSDAQNLEVSRRGGVANNISSNVNYGLAASGNCFGSLVAGNGMVSNAIGIVLTGAQGLTINGDNFAGSNSLAGLAVYGDSTGTLITGGIYSNNGVGITLAGATNLEISNKGGVANTIASNVNYGLFASGVCANTVIEGNAIFQNFQGVVLSNAQGLTVRGGNTVSASTIASMLVAGVSTGTTIVGNVLTGGTYGLYLDNATGLVFGGAAVPMNSMSFNSGAGLFAVGSCAGTTITNTWIGLNGVGVSLSSATGLAIDGSNMVATNTNYAFYATGDCGGTVVRDNDFLTSAYGVVLSAARNLTVNSGNRINRNTLFGLYATGNSTGTTVVGNTISGNGTEIDTSTATGGTFQTS